ncbi:MAG TPA: HAMP domain-containing sensor histidine kinase [Chitinophagaceae bacterium]|nr:HAMP domain-containing sensor histidine kinase [Chitinophagaceae bacterium]
MKKLRGQGILMVAVLLAIAGFQVYWIRDNYYREKKALEVKAQAIFYETVREVQDAKLRKRLRLVMEDSTQAGEVKFRSAAPRTTRVLHVLSEQLQIDTSSRQKGVTLKVVNRDLPRARELAIDSNGSSTFEQIVMVGADASAQLAKSQHGSWTNRPMPTDSFAGREKKVSTIYFNNSQGQNFRINVDSLFYDSLRVNDLDTAFAKKLAEQKIDISFKIIPEPGSKTGKSNMTFTRRPFTFESFEGYSLQLGNTFPFLLRKISLPILFSIFLVGLSILSFALLYRNLLRQHKLAEMKNDLISNITHELKTPIATVGVAIEALKNFNAIQDPQKTKEYLDISHNELQRLGLLVDKVLKLSMFENNAIGVKMEIIDLGDVVSEVISSLKLQLEKSNASIQVNTEGDLRVNADRHHLVSVVFNLLDNALKYNKGSVDIQLNLKEEDENIILNVSDNGIGIPAHYQDRIFEKFFRVPAGDTHNAKGHGLGLSYVARVIHEHNGSIRVESSDGAGSSFTIILPKPK